MLPELGHMNPTFRIARTLKTRGHDVRYLAIPDVARHVQSQGFEPVVHLEEAYPPGSLERINTLDKREVRKNRTETFERTAKELLSAETAVLLEKLAPDVIAIDVVYSLMAFLARKLRKKSIGLSTALPQTRGDPGVPPQRSGLIFRPGLRGQARAELEWQRFIAKRKLAAAAMKRLGFAPPYALALEAAPRFGIGENVPLDRYPMFMPQLLEMTELVLCPEAFDFPRPHVPRRHYVESFDRERKDSGNFPWEKIDANKPLVYCSMSSQKFRPGLVKKFFEVVLEVFRKRSEWQLILSLGPHARAEELSRIPPNVLAVERAPQLPILARARAMITHGGLGSVKEAIMNGVPMIVFPLDVDQPGNAARVVYHRIGDRGDVAKPDAGALEKMLGSALADSAVRGAIAKMRARFHEVENADFGADLLERYTGDRLDVHVR